MAFIIHQHITIYSIKNIVQTIGEIFAIIL